MSSAEIEQDWKGNNYHRPLGNETCKQITATCTGHNLFLK